MIAVDNIQKWVMLTSAVIAAVVSSWNLWTKFRENEDKIKVGFGPLEPPIEPGYWLHVISKSNYPMSLKDYGFINESGKLLSLPQLDADEPPDENVCIRGKSFFNQRGDLFETGPIILRDKQIGAFAIIVGQERSTLNFQYGMPFYKRFWIRLKIWWKPKYQ
jgi:hypothetical protein